MTLLYKLTENNNYTRYHTMWGENITHCVDESYPGTELCTNQVIHAYEHPVIAVLMDPVHAQFGQPLLWEAEGEVIVREGQLKCGVKKLTTVRQIALPRFTRQQRQEIMIRCALKVYRMTAFTKWAKRWLDGSDRSRESAVAAGVEHEIKTPPTTYLLGRYTLESVFMVDGYTINTNIAKSIEQASKLSGHTLDVIKIVEQVLKSTKAKRK